MSALKEETDALNIKHAELTDEELKSVTGGWSQNADGTYNFYAGDTFRGLIRDYTVEETKLNATLETEIRCEYFKLDRAGNLSDYGKSYVKVDQLLSLL